MHLIGLARIGADAVVRFLPDGTPVVNLSLAFNYGQKNQEGKRPTQWIDAALWGERAQNAAPYLLKGTLLEVHLADPHLETYPARDGSQGTKIVAKVSHFDFAAAPPATGQQQGQPAPQRQSQPSQREQARDRQHAASNGRPAPDFSDMDQNIPF